MSRKLNVYLCGKKTGVLSEDEQLQLSFQYSNVNVKPLSVCLPVRTEKYSHTHVYPFFENIIPEGEAFEILTKDHVSGNKVYSFLDRFGGDCAGAVAFYENTPANDTGKNLNEITFEKIAHIIDRLPEDPLLTSLENPPRLSLAGAQSKFAVYKIDNKYYRSDDNHPTTHIIKITNKRFPGLLENELFCMKLAKIMQMDVPDVELKDSLSRPYLEIKRFDRCIENGIVSRIHQEDFCQALGIVSNKKYQSGGGPGLRDCKRVIDEFSDNKLADITGFVEWIIFNYFTGNTDAHAKNLSLLHTETGIRLAPFYDLLSTEVYPMKLIDHYTAMLINGKGRYDSAGKNDFLALFEQLGLNAANMMKSIKSRFTGIAAAAESLRESLVNIHKRNKDKTKIVVFDEIIKIIKKRYAILYL